MATGFENGIARYVHAVAKVDVYFPVDHRGNSHICCEQCFYYRESSHSCALNHEVCAFPSRYVGGMCPLVSVTDEQSEALDKLMIEIAEANDTYPKLETE